MFQAFLYLVCESVVSHELRKIRKKSFCVAHVHIAVGTCSMSMAAALQTFLLVECSTESYDEMHEMPVPLLRVVVEKISISRVCSVGKILFFYAGQRVDWVTINQPRWVTGHSNRRTGSYFDSPWLMISLSRDARPLFTFHTRHSLHRNKRERD
jgi:hypothetical protein